MSSSYQKQLDEALKKKEKEVDTDEEVQQVWQKSRRVQEDSVQATRRALDTLRSTERTGEAALRELERQGEVLESVQSRMDSVQEKAITADKLSNQLHQYSGMVPVNVRAALSRRPQKVSPVAAPEPRAGQPSATGTKPPPQARPDLSNLNSNLNARAEVEISDNLAEMSQSLGRLQGVSQSMNQEITRQNDLIAGIDRQVDNADQILKKAERKTQEFIRK